MANDLVCSQINKLTLEFMDNAERILYAMFSAFNNTCNDLLETSLSTSPKVTCLLAYMLEFTEQFLDYIASLVALDVEIEFNLGWIDFEADEQFMMGNVSRAKKRRHVGQH